MPLERAMHAAGAQFPGYDDEEGGGVIMIDGTTCAGGQAEQPSHWRRTQTLRMLRSHAPTPPRE